MFDQSKWITLPESIGFILPEFRYTVNPKEKILSAVIHLSAHGIYRLFCDGKQIGNDLLTPGWTSHTGRLQYQSYDITKYICEKTDISILCANGWAEGRLGWIKTENAFTSGIAVLAEIDITYENGAHLVIGTDESWKVYTSHILFSEYYDGETVDLTADIRFIGYAKEDHAPRPALVPHLGEYVREQERVAATRMIITPKGERVIDFGQNLAGYAEIRTDAPAGSRIVIRHAEILDKDGNFYTENLRTAKNTVSYVTNGQHLLLKPTFSFQGFRYICLDEFPGQPELSDFTAVAIYSNMKRTGYFSCGNAMINQLYSNALWGQRSNFIDVPTDCPQRDERLGWTGDAAVFCRTAAINYDVEKFFAKWLGDMAIDQQEDGGIGGVIPAVPGLQTNVSAAWGDAAVICPFEIYLAYGNKVLLAQNFPMMKKWVDYMHSFGEEEYLWIAGRHYGDWLATDNTSGNGVVGATQTDLIASAYFAHSTDLLIRAGQILGEDMHEYELLYRNIKNAFRAAFMKNGLPVIYPKADAFSKARTVRAETQTALVLILRFGLYTDSERDGLLLKLKQLIAQNEGRMSTGFVGTPHILHALSDAGCTDLAYDLLFQERSPSWLFSVKAGATTIWEHWDSQLEDGSIYPPEMNSFNHYAYGSVIDWLFGVALGIKIPDEGAGYTKLLYAPHPDRRLGHAEFQIESRTGPIRSAWAYLPDGRVRYELTVPAGCTVQVNIPGIQEQTLIGGSHIFTV